MEVQFCMKILGSVPDFESTLLICMYMYSGSSVLYFVSLYKVLGCFFCRQSLKGVYICREGFSNSLLVCCIKFVVQSTATVLLQIALKFGTSDSYKMQSVQGNKDFFLTSDQDICVPLNIRGC